MLRSGERFAGYLIERELGRGGMGAVYLAQHPRLPRRTALKLLNRDLFGDNETRTRFEREADLVSRLEHPQIVPIYDRGVEGDQLWISMRYVDGPDASTLDSAKLPPAEAVRIIAETAKALDFAHRKGILHRDVKPANILLENDEGEQRVFLADFGIARLRDDATKLTMAGSFTATLAYAAPEQLTGQELDHRCDQYSLACTLFRLLTGNVPFTAEHPVAIMQGHLNKPPPRVSELRPGLPPALDAVMARALGKSPATRFDSCTDFANAAQQALLGSAGHPNSAAPASAAGKVGSASSPGLSGRAGSAGNAPNGYWGRSAGAAATPPPNGRSTPPQGTNPPLASPRGAHPARVVTSSPAMPLVAPAGAAHPAAQAGAATPVASFAGQAGSGPLARGGNPVTPTHNPATRAFGSSVPRQPVVGNGRVGHVPGARPGPGWGKPVKPVKPRRKKSRMRGCLLGVAVLIVLSLLAIGGCLAVVDQVIPSKTPTVVTTTVGPAPGQEEQGDPPTWEQTFEPTTDPVPEGYTAPIG